MKVQRYEIGQVLYMLTPKSMIIPMVVIEENTKKTLEGTTVSHIVKYPSQSNNGESEINTGVLEKYIEVGNQCYTSMDEVRTTLTLRANEQIEKLITQAATKDEAFRRALGLSHSDSHEELNHKVYDVDVSDVRKQRTG